MAVWCGLLILEGENFEMKIDLKNVAEAAGIYETVREVDTGKPIREVKYPLAKARKLCRLILKHADPEDLEEVSRQFKVNSKLMKMWEEEKCRLKR